MPGRGSIVLAVWSWLIRFSENLRNPIGTDGGTGNGREADCEAEAAGLCSSLTWIWGPGWNKGCLTWAKICSQNSTQKQKKCRNVLKYALNMQKYARNMQ